MTSKIGPRELALRAMTERRMAEAEAQEKTNRRHAKALKQLRPGELDAMRALEKKIMTEASASKPSIPPVEASAKQQEKKTMAKKAKAKKAPRAKKTRKTPIKKPSAAAAGDDSSKTAQVVAMIRRPGGVTSQEVCIATGWAAVSIPPIAARAGVKLRKEKEGRSVRYFEAA